MIKDFTLSIQLSDYVQGQEVSSKISQISHRDSKQSLPNAVQQDARSKIRKKQTYLFSRAGSICRRSELEARGKRSHQKVQSCFGRPKDQGDHLGRLCFDECDS